jgi:CheY-like chemotaxis protein
MTTVLVIDDDAIVRETIIQVLEVEGYTVLSATDGKRGLALFASARPDLVITDIIMPEMDGIRMIAAIRELSPTAKVIVISGGARISNANFRQSALLLGAADAIEKPFDLDDFLARIEKCLAVDGPHSL